VSHHQREATAIHIQVPNRSHERYKMTPTGVTLDQESNSYSPFRGGANASQDGYRPNLIRV